MVRSRVSNDEVSLVTAYSTSVARAGTLVVHPILQPSTAYWMLRPFFKPTQGTDSLNGWKFSLDDDVGWI